MSTDLSLSLASLSFPSALLSGTLLVGGCASHVIAAPAEGPEAAGSTTTDDEHRKPDVILGVGLFDNHFYMPFMLVRHENITIDIKLERSAPAGNVISCKLTSGDTTVSSDMGNACHLFVSGNGLRHYVLHIYNVDEDHSHQVFITGNRGKSRT